MNPQYAWKYMTDDEIVTEYNAVISDEEFSDESEDDEEEDNIEFPEDAASEDSTDDSDVDLDFEPSVSDIEENIISTIREILEGPGTSVQPKLGQKRKTGKTRKQTEYIKTTDGISLKKSKSLEDKEVPQQIGETENGKETYKVTIDGEEILGRDMETKWVNKIGKHNKTSQKNIVHKRINTLHSAADAYEPLDCFMAFFTPEIIGTVLEHSNKEMNKKKSTFSQKRKNSSTFKDLVKEELEAFLGLLILSGALKNNHIPVTKLYNPRLCGERYQATLSINRFRFISTSLRFDDRETRKERKKTNKFALVSQIWNMLIDQCKKNYKPSSYLTIGEQLVGFRDRCPFRTYMPNKRNKYGIKILMMCDQATQYMINAIPYLGKSSTSGKISASSHFIKTLVEPMSGSNRNITANSWFTSVPLVEELLDKFQLTYIGTIKKNKLQLPYQFINIKYKNRNVGSSLFIFRKNMTAVSYKAKKNKLVTLISTFHNDDAVNTLGKAEIVLNYSNTKNAVDAFDQMCQHRNCGRKTKRWPACIFYNMINIACINAYVVYVHNFYKKKSHDPSSPSEKQEKPLSRFDFMLKLEEQLSQPWLRERLKMPITKSLRQSIKRCLLNGVQEPTNVEQTNDEPAIKKRRYCTFCDYKKQRKSKMECDLCRTPVCGEHYKKICANCDRM
ncbi:PREDICTED: piggyBac transposable element-derived protein 4-like [Dinoponera quadriceps]|uniref:PiggyBac transposable element-derived protein 4-like n=1 Tax=Dinoponera quadriceps TaxID=609295 RepID=A0A6P3XNQ3_DINQU|nr:PREDICTED: piggyBac transposable element-derived protein 4-like [Dinoponera quadriceps]XP_014480096.1 PREDICTED: piggyBac transposable element-derived protein 4-like [Dinoponera quadriceps]XP_014480097.1 PREDICTED: piggyBac transposable element-derived protein 4-like [Dinoponera quadriceps]